MSDTLPAISLDLLDRYLTGDATLGERAAVDAWLATNPQHRRLIAALSNVEFVATPRPSNVPAAWERFARAGLNRANGSASKSLSKSLERERSNRGRSQISRALAIACAVVLMAGLAIVGVSRYKGASGQPETQRFATGPGQRSIVHLAGGSTMVLAPATSVAVTSMAMEIVGQAYFTVAPNPGRPFIVRTHNAVIRVLGTRFSVRQYADESKSRVVVDDGKVALDPIGKRERGDIHAVDTQTVLSARMAGVVSDSSVVVTAGIAGGDDTAWMHDRLVFERTPLRDVVAELSRVYGAEVRIVDTALANRSMTMQVSFTTQPLTQVLDIISRVHDAHVTRSNNGFVLTPGRGVTQTPQVKHFPQPEKLYGR